MKTFMGIFWQETLIKLNITPNEYFILDWFRQANPKMEKVTIENEEYTIISYDKIMQDLPWLALNSKTLQRINNSLGGKKIIKSISYKYHYKAWKFGEEWSNLYPGDKEVKEDVYRTNNSNVYSTWGNNNNTCNNSNNKQSDDYKRDFKVYESQIKEIIEYFNDYCSLLNTTYKHDNEYIYKPIIDNLRKGYKPQDFREVIRKKYCEWYNNLKLRPYIRPQTLFGDKFELYLTGPEPEGYSWHGKTDEEIEAQRARNKETESEVIQLG